MTSPATDELASLFGADTRSVLRRIGAHPVSAEAAAIHGAIWTALAQAGGLRPAETRSVLPVAELMGEALYRSPYLDTLTAIDVITAAGDRRRWQPVLSAVGDGDVAIAVTLPGTRLARCADMADMLLDMDGPAVTLTELHQPGVEVRQCLDLARGGLFEVRVASAVTPAVSGAGPAAPLLDGALDRDRARRAAYLTGLSRGALDLAVGHARNRIVFGRPLGGHQAPAFRLAALAARIEAVRSLAYQGDHPGYALRLARDLAIDTTSEALQLHGAAGLLDTSDAQLFYRCALTETALAR
jgi:hypothetical protein